MGTAAGRFPRWSPRPTGPQRQPTGRWSHAHQSWPTPSICTSFPTQPNAPPGAADTSDGARHWSHAPPRGPVPRTAVCRATHGPSAADEAAAGPGQQAADAQPGEGLQHRTSTTSGDGDLAARTDAPTSSPPATATVTASPAEVRHGLVRNVGMFRIVGGEQEIESWEEG